MAENSEDQGGAESMRTAHRVTWFSGDRPVSGTVSVRRVDDAGGPGTSVAEDPSD